MADTLFYVHHSVKFEEDDTKRGKEKPAVKMEKPKNVLRSKTTNRHTAFKCTIRGDC